MIGCGPIGLVAESFIVKKKKPFRLLIHDTHCACWTPLELQRNDLVILSNLTIVNLETTIHESIWIGMLANTDLVKVILPANERNFAFQPSNRLLISWHRSLKNSDSHRPLYIGAPRKANGKVLGDTQVMP